MKKQNRENEQKNSDTHRQEREKATGRKKGEGAIRKRRSQEIATKPKIMEGKDSKEKAEQRIMTG